jgi:hypothetical protein
MLQTGKYHQREIAEFMDLSQGRIYQVARDLEKYTVHLIDEIDVKKVASSAKTVAERVKVELAKQNDWAGVWRVEKELVELLQSMGFVREVPKKLEVSLEEKAKAWDQMFGIPQQVNAN